MDNRSMETTGAVIKRIRLERGWSQKELARRAGVTQPLISYIEGGGKLTRLVARALAAAFEVPFEEFENMVFGRTKQVSNAGDRKE